MSGATMRVDEMMAEVGARERLPYALVKVQSPKYQHVWLPVNRDYRRRGEGGWCDHARHIDNAMVFARDPHLFSGVWATTTEAACYLYIDPWEAVADYGERLERLFEQYWFWHGDPPALHFAPLLPGH